MIRYRAPWILPIVRPPIRGGFCDVDRGRVVNVGGPGEESRGRPEREFVLDNRVILPGLVNAHTHLELSALRGRVGRSPSVPSWVRELLGLAEQTLAAGDGQAIAEAIEEAWRAGTAVVGDVSNTLAPVRPLRQSGRLAASVFREVIGFPEVLACEAVERASAEIAALGPDDRVRLTLSAHAPYSVGPATLRRLRAARERLQLSPTTVHVAESVEEIEFLQTGEGPWRAVLYDRGRWDADWTPPQASPVRYLDGLGWVTADTLLVHGVHMTEADLSLLGSRGATLVTCPRSNLWTGAGVPPVARFYEAGVRVAVGTDSLASAPDLNLFHELAGLRRLAPTVSAAQLLASATVHGAGALGFGSDFGAIAPGYSSALIGVSVPAGVADVEEYLVSSIEPDQITWLEEFH
jgi:cytosine/adenosine deaminase-related metal-dependent hydrolase